MDKEYIAGGRFIHDEIARRCLSVIDKVVDLWRRDRRIDPSLLLWPSEVLRTTKGEPFDGVVYAALPRELNDRRTEISKAAKACSAFCLLTIEQLETSIRLIFESEHGTRTWHLQIENHGDVKILGRPTVKDNTESIGIRWHAN